MELVAVYHTWIENWQLLFNTCCCDFIQQQPEQVGVGCCDFIPSKNIKTLDDAKIITICYTFQLLFAIQQTIPDEITITAEQSFEVRSLIMFRLSAVLYAKRCATPALQFGTRKMSAAWYSKAIRYSQFGTVIRHA
jgi:hypothetical protein